MTTVEDNKKRFLEILREVDREGMDKLIDWLKTTDFFTAPASTRFHESYEGGLCEHSLHVYDKFIALQDAFPEVEVSNDSVILCTLLHDLTKANFYEVSTRNVKNEETGQWEKVPYYTIKDAFPMGHGEKSVFLIERFVRLKPKEAIAIRWHMGGFDNAVKGGDYSLSGAYEQYPFAALLHLADMAATYLK